MSAYVVLFLATYVPLDLVTGYCMAILQGRSHFRRFNLCARSYSLYLHSCFPPLRSQAI